MGWFDGVIGRLAGRANEATAEQRPDVPAPPTSAEILAAVQSVEDRVSGRVGPAVSSRVHRITVRIAEMVPRLDRMGVASLEAHTVVQSATSYLPEAVDTYLRLPRDFADRRVVANGKTSLMLLCDQLDLLAVTLGKISDAVSRSDANALVAHGEFLASKFSASSLALGTETRGVPAQPDTAPGSEPGRLEAP